MFKDISIEQRAHDLAVRATISYYEQSDERITDTNAFEAGIHYRRIYKNILDSLTEGESDLR